MNEQKRFEIIKKMINQNLTIESVTMFVKKLEKGPAQLLNAFLEEFCKFDIFKMSIVAKTAPIKNKRTVQKKVREILTDRCKTAESFTYLDLLAIAVYESRPLLKSTAKFFNAQCVKKAFAFADAHIACRLLSMCLENISKEPCEIVQKEFCKFLVNNNSNIDEELSTLVPVLLEYKAADVLSTLINLVGAKQIEKFCTTPLVEQIDEMICDKKDSIPFWEVFFDEFFSRRRSEKQLLQDGLWYIQMNASDDIYNEVGAMFYLRVAMKYGVDHPIFEYVESFSNSQKHTRKYIAQYKEKVDSLWEQPEALCDFLNKTAICNPFLVEYTIEKKYKIFEKNEDPISYGKLTRLFQAKATPLEILNIFLSTDLKDYLPLEDVFYLAQCYEVLPEFLEAVKGMQFFGSVTNRNERYIYLYPFSYHVCSLHFLNASQQLDQKFTMDVKLKGKTISYTIVDFNYGRIFIEYSEPIANILPNTESLISWPAAIEEFRELLELPTVTIEQLHQLNVLKFEATAFASEADFNLFTNLFIDFSSKIFEFSKVLELSVWNKKYSNETAKIKKDEYDALKPYYELTVKLFKKLFAFQKPSLVLKLYFNSIYKAILPLNELLFMAEKKVLLKALSKVIINCRLKDGESRICRPTNILCTPICVTSNANNVANLEIFSAYVSDFLVSQNGVYQIVLEYCENTENSVGQRGNTFGFLSKNIYISDWREKLIAKFPGTDRYTYREIIFNMVCMEDAIFIRREKSNALQRLIRVLGQANPFAFSVSGAADLIYFKMLYPNKDRSNRTRGAAITILLNATDINCVREAYLNTNIKYHITLTEFARLIRERRSDLAEQIPTMFNSVEFTAAADNDGNLWMPWIEQNTIRVSKEYAGKLLRCTIQMDNNGTISAHVIDANRTNDRIDEIFETCQLAGYQSASYMQELQISNNLEDGEATDKNSTFDVKLSFEENIAGIKEQFDNPNFMCKQVAKDIGKVIRYYSNSISDWDMEDALAPLTEEWIQKHPDATALHKYWYGIHLCFVHNYSSFGMSRILVEQFYEYLYGRAAIYFEEKINDSIAKDIAQTPPFEQAMDNARNMLNNEDFEHKTFKKHLNAIIMKYNHKITAEKMKEGLLCVTAEYIQRYPDEQRITTTLQDVYAYFYLYYKSFDLGIAFVGQYHQYLEGVQAYKFERNLKNFIFKKQTPTAQQDANAQNESCETSVLHNTETSENLLFNTELQQMQQSLFGEGYSPRKFSRGISKLIKKYAALIPADIMSKSIVELIAKWLQQYPEALTEKTLMVGLHTCFVSQYKSNDLGLAICEMLEKKFDANTVAQTTFLIKKQMASPDVVLYSGTNEESAFEDAIKQLCSVMNDKNVLPNQFAKLISKTIRTYSATVCAQDMEKAIANVTDEWIPLYIQDPQMPHYLIGIVSAFAVRYHSFGLKNAVCRQIGQYKGKLAAEAFEQRFENTREYKELKNQTK